MYYIVIQPFNWGFALTVVLKTHSRTVMVILIRQSGKNPKLFEFYLMAVITPVTQDFSSLLNGGNHHARYTGFLIIHARYVIHRFFFLSSTPVTQDFLIIHARYTGFLIIHARYTTAGNLSVIIIIFNTTYYVLLSTN